MGQFSQYGKVKTVITKEFPQESLWGIQFVLPEYADLIVKLWNPNELIDLGGGTKILTYQTVFVKGKEFLAELLKEEVPDPLVIDELWARLERAAKEEPFLSP
jgi:hypothetical protein